MFLLLLLLPVENVTAAGTDSQAVFRACDDSRGLLMGGSSSLRLLGKTNRIRCLASCAEGQVK